MAQKRNIELQQRKLKLRAELLRETVREVDAREKKKALRVQLRAMGGRVRI